MLNNRYCKVMLKPRYDYSKIRGYIPTLPWIYSHTSVNIFPHFRENNSHLGLEKREEIEMKNL